MADPKRNELLKINREKNLGIKGTKNMSTEELEKAVTEALKVKAQETADQVQNLEEQVDNKAQELSNKVVKGGDTKEGEVVYISSYPKQFIGHIQFQDGIYKTSDPKEIEMIESNNKFGVTINRR